MSEHYATQETQKQTVQHAENDLQQEGQEHEHHDQTQTRTIQSFTEMSDFLKDPRKVPCFRDSLMWGIPIGVGISFLQHMRHRRPLTTIRSFVFGTVAAATIYYLPCRSKVQANKERNMVLIQQQKLLREYADSHAIGNVQQESNELMSTTGKPMRKEE